MGNLKNIPTLRFPEFTGEWEKKKLGEVAELTSSKRVYANDYVPDGIPFYRGKEITELKENKKPSDILYISNTAYEKFKETFGVPQINDLLITAVGTLGNVLTIKNNEPFYFKDGNLIWLRKVNQLSEFLEIILYFNFKAIEKSSIGSSQKALTMVELRKLSFLFPSLPEQEKIASFLSAVDDKLQALKKKKSLLDKYKKGVMQKIFSQELRFKDDDGGDFPEWDVKALGDVFERVTRKNKENNLNVLTFSAHKGLINQRDYYSKNIASNDVRHYYLLNKGDFAYNKGWCDGYPFGAIKKLKFYEKGVISTLYICFSLKDKEEHSEIFFEYFFDSGKLDKGLSEVVTEGARNHGLLNIAVGDFFNTLFLDIPQKEEQTKIANFLSAIDEKIIHVQGQIEKTEMWKKGLLHKMFV